MSNEQIEYHTKDNSKLRRLLRERDMSDHGDRKELIARLERSTIDYNNLSVEQMNQMLKDRGLRMSQMGTKETKIARLRLNDKEDRDTGCIEDGGLYAQLSVYERVIGDLLEKQRIAMNDMTYSNLQPARILALIRKRYLSETGSTKVLIKRLQNYDRKTIAKDLKKIKNLHDSVKPKLESRLGHPINTAIEVLDHMSTSAEDYALVEEVRQRPSKPMCSYNWRDSHWADRTYQQLTEICTRRGMPGHGPKAAMLKWLDTGELDYEDLFITSLESLCKERGLPCKSTSKKDDLVKLLRENDEMEV
ncbi:hypothetical protein B7463_g663, partial [Scytalidium lignicola]